MLSLFPRPNRFTLDTRRDHIAERDRALCYPSTSASSPSDLPSSEIDIQAGDQEILSCGLEELAQAIASSRWTSEQVCLAFIRSSRRAQKAINCITVPNYQAAIARARQLDQHLKETGKTAGTFHGIPFSFKENNNIKGLTTTVGYTAWVLDGPAKEDAALARMVQHLGGVIIVKTNIPQTMMSFECFNPLYDRTLNPWSPAHGPGGSSGGEAALLGADGAVAGFGSDIGGSLRLPTGYCGIYALKPTAGRFPSAGAKSARAGFDGIVSVFGPMTRSSADLEFLSRSLIELIHPNVDSSLDPWAAQDRFGCEELRASPLRPAWLDPIKAASSRDGDHKKIRMGYYYCDGFTQTSPACIRAVQESIEALKASEHAGRYEFIEVDPKRLRAKEAMHIFLSNVTADNFNGLLGPLRQGRIKEAMDFALFLPVFSTRAPRWARGLFRWVVQYLVKDPHLSYMLSAGGAKSAEGYMQQIARRKEFEKQFIKDIWKFYQLDGIICPIQASPAIPHGACAKLSTLACSTILYNVLDYAVSICPITRVDPELDAVPAAPTAKSDEKPSKAYTAWSSTPGFDTCSKMVSYSLYGEGVYDATKMSGLPVGVQVVTKKFEEEKAIGLMCLLDEANRKRSKHAWGPGQYTEKMYS